MKLSGIFDVWLMYSLQKCATCLVMQVKTRANCITHQILEKQCYLSYRVRIKKHCLLKFGTIWEMKKTGFPLAMSVKGKVVHQLSEILLSILIK